MISNGYRNYHESHLHCDDRSGESSNEVVFWKSETMIYSIKKIIATVYVLYLEHARLQHVIAFCCDCH